MARVHRHAVAGTDQFGEVRRVTERGTDETADRRLRHQPQRQRRQRRHGCGLAGHARSRLEHLAIRSVLAAEDVGLADLALVERQQDPVGYVLDVDQRDPEVGEGEERQPALDNPFDQLAELGMVARPVNAARLDDHAGKAVADHLLGDPVRPVFRLLVVGTEPFAGMLVGLVDDLAVGIAEGADCADVDDLRRACLTSCGEDVRGAGDVGLVHRLPPAGGDPDLVDRSSVDRCVAALEARGDRCDVADVALDQLAAEPGEAAGLLGRAHQRPHLVAALAQLAGDMGADEAGRAGLKDLHESGPYLRPRNLNGMSESGPGDGSDPKAAGLVNSRARWRALAIGILPDGGPSPVDPLAELKELLRTAGVATAGEMVQRRSEPDPDRYFGRGKLAELKAEIKRTNANLVACDDELLPRQGRNLESELGVSIVDRTSVILDIFADHAFTAEGKLQVELARLEYDLARLRGMWTHLERLGGTGTRRGPGEAQIETDRRLVRNRINTLRRRLAETEANREVMRATRDAAALPTIALAGYTNAGKSTLLNAITGSEVEVRDRLFHTLAPTTRSYEHRGRTYLMTDTVGFIKKLPHQVVDAFKATLEETVRADLILHVVDAAQPPTERGEAIAAVEGVLEEIGADEQPRLLVFNKLDLLDEEDRQRLLVGERDIVGVSAESGEGLTELLEAIETAFEATRCEMELLIPYREGGTLSELHAIAGELEREDGPDGVLVRASVPRNVAHRFERYSANGSAA